MAQSKAKITKKAQKTKKAPLKSKSKSVAKTKAVGKIKTQAKTQAKPKPKAKLAAKSQSKANSTTQKRTSSKQTSSALSKSKSASSTSVKMRLTSLTPLDDRLVVSIEKPKEKTAGGLFIPSTAHVGRSDIGYVIAVGRGHQDKKGRLKSMDVQVGDQVLFNPYAGTEAQFDGQDVMILRESDIMGVVES